MEGERHHQPGAQSQPARRSIVQQRKQGRHQIDQGHSGNSAGESERRVTQLGVGRARDHAPDLPEAAVGPQAGGAPRQAEPDRPLPLQATRQCAVVDDLRPDRCNPAGALERVAPHQGASAGGSGRPAVPSRDPGERIEHLEQVDEGRNEEPLGPAHAGGRHQRDPPSCSARMSGARDPACRDCRGVARSARAGVWPISASVSRK